MNIVICDRGTADSLGSLLERMVVGGRMLGNVTDIVRVVDVVCVGGIHDEDESRIFDAGSVCDLLGAVSWTHVGL